MCNFFLYLCKIIKSKRKLFADSLISALFFSPSEENSKREIHLIDKAWPIKTNFYLLIWSLLGVVDFLLLVSKKLGPKTDSLAAQKSYQKLNIFVTFYHSQDSILWLLVVLFIFFASLPNFLSYSLYTLLLM